MNFSFISHNNKDKHIIYLLDLEAAVFNLYNCFIGLQLSITKRHYDIILLTPINSVFVHLPPTALSEVCLWELHSLTSNAKSCDFLPPLAIKGTPLCYHGQHLCLFFPFPPPVSHKQTHFSKRECQQRPHKCSWKKVERFPHTRQCQF